MRVVRVNTLPIVIRVQTPREVVVALPRAEPADEVLKLASLVLSGKEFEELRDAFRTGRPIGKGRAASPPPV